MKINTKSINYKRPNSYYKTRFQYQVHSTEETMTIFRIFTTILSITLCLSICHSSNILAMSLNTESNSTRRSIKSSLKKEEDADEALRNFIKSIRKTANNVKNSERIQSEEKEEVKKLMRASKAISPQSVDTTSTTSISLYHESLKKLFSDSLEFFITNDLNTQYLIDFTSLFISECFKYRQAKCENPLCFHIVLFPPLGHILKEWLNESFPADIEEKAISEHFKQLHLAELAPNKPEAAL